MHRPIIPGLPDDLGLRCLAMLSHGYHGVMEAVSKRWRDVMRGEEYANYKARQGWCGDWLFVLPEGTLTHWIAYDPEADRWHPLPPRPHLHYGMNYFGCHCVYNKFLVIGGRYWNIDQGQRPPRAFISNQVFQFDPFNKEWSTLASMRTSRYDFASCTMDGKIYVAGGCNYSDYPYPEGMNLAEVYDPLTDKWEDLPPMHLPAKSCIGIPYKGKFHVINVHSEDQSQTEVFDPFGRSWHIKHESWFSRTTEVAVTDDQVYTINELNGSIERRDAEKDEWHIVGGVPPLFDPADSQLPQADYYGLAALGHELYAIGVNEYMIDDEDDEEEVDLNRVKVCDPRCLPLIWRETRPMCLAPNASGFIMGWASLKQQ